MVPTTTEKSGAFRGAIDENLETTFLVAMRLGDTPVPIPNTMVKTQAADDTMLETAWESRWMPDSLWGCSSVGRAPALQAGGQEFESLHLHSPKGDITYVP